MRHVSELRIFFPGPCVSKIFTEESKMIELIKKAVLTGVGVASLTKDKLEDLGRELIAKGKMSEQEGEKFIEEMLSRAEESRATVKTQTESLVQSTIAKMKLARGEDIDALKKEIELLRQEVAALQKDTK
jgi:polyhydroxyalkanoate synthesis regulator phasin